MAIGWATNIIPMRFYIDDRTKLKTDLFLTPIP